MKIRKQWHNVLPKLTPAMIVESWEGIPPVDIKVKKEEKVTIQLSEIEAGFLRTIILKLGNKIPTSFVGELSWKLAKLDLPKYDRIYPNWKRQIIYKCYTGVGDPTIEETFYKNNEVVVVPKPKFKKTDLSKLPIKPKSLNKPEFNWL